MKKTVVAAMFLAGLGGAASAATTTLDFTTAGINAATAAGTQDGFAYAITGMGGTLTDATHGFYDGCDDPGWDSACATVGSLYDVGFGIDGGGINDNEIDNDGNPVPNEAEDEYVVVSFNGLVKVLGFAGMLAYNIGVQPPPVECGDDAYVCEPVVPQRPAGETVILEYTDDGGLTWNFAGEAFATFYENDGAFDSVGLAFNDMLDGIIANAVRFTAGGTDDDFNINVTAAGLRIASVPVPASFPLLLAGIGALGFAARRKRRNAA